MGRLLDARDVLTQRAQAVLQTAVVDALATDIEDVRGEMHPTYAAWEIDPILALKAR